MPSHRSDEALRRWLDRARTLQGGREHRTFDTWAAEIQARTGQPDAAVRTYESLLDEATADAALALDAAETLLDNGYAAHARPLLRRAHDQARNSGGRAVADKARVLLDQGDWLDGEGSRARNESIRRQ
ncbi:MAG TPA: hypothetical protein VKP69_24670 [Isosphaeraceae bacterium]|nr:hypothetical protein [Isosphaeraceae bacterium]